jgi:hypothetical protein
MLYRYDADFLFGVTFLTELAISPGTTQLSALKCPGEAFRMSWADG